ncbi:MAG: sulfotransferase [Planctomycetota bacterium]
MNLKEPNFLVIGASKCGTSTLRHLLNQHPDVFVSMGNEPYFFSNDEYYNRGWDWYTAQFEMVSNEKAVGEGCGRYAMCQKYPETVERAARHLPSAKIIYIVRHPMQRIVSDFLQKREQGDPLPPNFLKAVRAYRRELVDCSNYLQQINAYREKYDDDEILVLFAEDLHTDPAGVLRRTFQFLGVDPAFVPPGLGEQKNTSQGKKIERPLMSTLRHIPYYYKVRDMLPEGLRRGFKKKYLTSEMTSKPTYDAQTYDWVCSILEQDSKTFLRRYGKPEDFWQFKSPAA